MNSLLRAARLGASGAIAGVMGAYLRLFSFNQIRVLLPLGWLMIPIRLPALVVIGFWIVLQFFDEFVSITEQNAQWRRCVSGAYRRLSDGIATGFPAAPTAGASLNKAQRRNCRTNAAAIRRTSARGKRIEYGK